MKYMEEFRSHFMKKPAFTAREAELFLENRKSSPNYYKLVIHNLLSRRDIYRITRGVYTFQEDAQMSGFGFSPFYYGLEDALSLRNVWKQECGNLRTRYTCIRRTFAYLFFLQRSFFPQIA